MKASDFFSVVQPSVDEIDSAYHRVMGELLRLKHAGVVTGTTVYIQIHWMRKGLCNDAPESEVDLGGPLWRKVKARFETDGWTVVPYDEVIVFGLRDA